MISIYCDGSSNGRSNSPIGYAFIILDESTGNIFTCGAEGDSRGGTNNIAEINAAIAGMKTFLKMRNSLDNPAEPVELVSDSMYMLDLGAGRSSPNKNIELARELRSLVVETGAKCRWVRGHSGNIWNVKCDELAKYARDMHTSDKKLRSKERRKMDKRLERKERRAKIRKYKQESDCG